MKCRKEIVLTGYRVQYIDLREPKRRIELDLCQLWEEAGKK